MFSFLLQAFQTTLRNVFHVLSKTNKITYELKHIPLAVHISAYFILRASIFYILQNRIMKTKRKISDLVTPSKLSTKVVGGLKKDKKYKKKYEEGNSSATRPPQRPNHFVALKVSEPEIHHLLEIVQQHIVTQDKKLKNVVIPISTMHITLMVMHLANTEEFSRACEILKEIHKKHNDIMVANPLAMEFRGLGHFGHKVLYAKLVDNNDAYARLTDLANDVCRHFKTESDFDVEENQSFTPHLTIMKLSRDPSIYRKGINKISPSLYSFYKDQCFGTQIVKGIQLLKMEGPTDKDGYYRGCELLFEATP